MEITTIWMFQPKDFSKPPWYRAAGIDSTSINLLNQYLNDGWNIITQSSTENENLITTIYTLLKSKDDNQLLKG